MVASNVIVIPRHSYGDFRITYHIDSTVFASSNKTNCATWRMSSPLGQKGCCPKGRLWLSRKGCCYLGKLSINVMTINRADRSNQVPDVSAGFDFFLALYHSEAVENRLVWDVLCCVVLTRVWITIWVRVNELRELGLGEVTQWVHRGSGRCLPPCLNSVHSEQSWTYEQAL